MSRSVNKITFVGHMGWDPELCETQSGTKVANLSLATNHLVSASRDSERERTGCHRLTLWSRLALFVEEYVRKGDRVYVEGRLKYDSYERDGVTIPTAEVNIRELVLLSPRHQAEAAVYSVRGPESRERFAMGTFAKLLEGSVSNLSDALPSYPKE